MKKLLKILLSTTLMLTIAGCGASSDTASVQSTSQQNTENKVDAKTSEAIEIKFLSNLPDRTSGQGLLEQTLIDKYISENPNVSVKVEALQDEAYKQKFKAYVTGNNLPDVYMVWGQPSFFEPVMKEGYALELNATDYESYEFLPGSLEGFSLDGKLYGLPRNTDVMVLYYNDKLFKDNGVTVPTTMEEFKTAIKTFREKGIAPIAMNGMDKWAMAIMYHDLVIKDGGADYIINKAIQDKNFSNPSILNAANEFSEFVNEGMYQDSFLNADYGAAQNLFTQGLAAMYYMGSWEVGMASNEELPQEFRDNLKVTVLPAGKTGKATDIMAWNGGGFAVSANSKVKDTAKDLLNYMMKPENWAKEAFQQGLGFPGQKFDKFLTGNESALQLDLIKILNDATSTSGTPFNDFGSPAFKTDSENLIQELAAKIKTPEQFVEGLNNSVK